MKTPIKLIYEALNNSDRSGFLDWIIENEEFLKEFEKQLIIEVVDSARGGDGEFYWDYYSGEDADIYLKKPFNIAKKNIENNK